MLSLCFTIGSNRLEFGSLQCVLLKINNEDGTTLWWVGGGGGGGGERILKEYFE